MEEPEVVEHFFGVYLLYSMNEKYKGRTYIGYTVNPNRRLKQHNAGKEFGGAYKTSNRGPWKMVLIVHGFPSSTSALTFEWAWQNPNSSRRLKHLGIRKNRQKVFNYCLLVLSEMLNVGPWNRLPLTIRWLDDDFYVKYAFSVSPPMHMPVTHGPVASKKLSNKNITATQVQNQDETHARTESSKPPANSSTVYCLLCNLEVEASDKITCVQPECFLVAHILCLGKSFWKNDGMLLPVDGICPACYTSVLWGDLIRKKIGCNLHLSEASDDLQDNSQNFENFEDFDDSDDFDDFEEKISTL